MMDVTRECTTGRTNQNKRNRNRNRNGMSVSVSRMSGHERRRLRDPSRAQGECNVNDQREENEWMRMRMNVRDSLLNKSSSTASA